MIVEIEKRSDGELRLTASTLYAALKRMLDSGWIAEVKRRAGDAGDDRRRTYRLTPTGREVLQREARRLERQVEMARHYEVIPTGAA